MSKSWDLTSGRSLDAAAEWLRKGSDACLVLVVRGEDVAFAVDAAIKPADALTMVEIAMPELSQKLEEQRERAKDDVRLKAIREQQRAAAEAVRAEKRK
jgi:hypothetical protein